MRVVIAGGHGKIAQRLERRLAQRGDEAIGLIRNPQQRADLRQIGAEAAVCDLETATADGVAQNLQGADAVVFAAGAGPGSGEARKETVDKNAAILLADAAEIAGVRRYVMVSAMGVDDEPGPDADPVFATYLRAKGAADADLRRRDGLEWTIIRPGRLTDEPGTGRVRLSESTGRGEVPRDDVAAVILAVLDSPAMTGKTLELISGTDDVIEAVQSHSNQ
ncbi:putative NAD(P)-binding protein [Stackebrandtia endophytica]|uniref:Putative NAD(P)-binding protein n=1 Tax=Stackebrandtia endophytica TaxID=1496996 RepID=A0A543AT18_9ACTN|nr:SDR family oxidoreductase [Stackebrandtia endophytica]TQL75655.1 putative NAD(P)-binding protein [Stackebrandtia endophytica]